VFLLWQQSLYDEIKAEAGVCGESVNDYVHSILKCAMQDNIFRARMRVKAMHKLEN
jgi:hypothetical protein